MTSQPHAPTVSVDEPAPWPAWPQWDDSDRELLLRALDGPWNGIEAPLVLEAEQAFADAVDARHAVSVTNGTISLEIALQAHGVGSGDEVIVPPYTFLATASAVLRVGGLPVFADLDAGTWNLDPSAVEKAITERTRAVIAVHLAGQPADLAALRQLCDRHQLHLIEDAAHAHGAVWDGRPVGTTGSYGSWSFQGSKNVTTGEGGMLTTDDDDLADAARVLRNCGRAVGGAWYEHLELGGNYRITSFQAALLIGGMRRLPAQVARREESAGILDERLQGGPGLEPLVRDPRVDVHAHHLYIMRHRPVAGGPSRDEVVARLTDVGVPALAGYPMPLYRQPLFAQTRFDRAATRWDPAAPQTRYADLHLPVVEAACEQAIWLPHEVLLADPERIERLATTLLECSGAPS